MNFRRFVKGILLEFVSSDPSDNKKGSLWYNSTSEKFKGYVNGAIRELLSNSDSQSVSNKNLADNSNHFVDNNDNTKKFRVDVEGSSSSKTTLKTNQTSDRTLNLPDATDTLVARNTTDLLKNKTLEDSTTVFQDNSDVSKKAKFQISDIAASTTRTFTLPDPGQDDNLVTDKSDSTLENKVLVDPQVSGFIDLNEITTPSAPSSNRLKLYFKSDKGLYKIDDNGDEALVGASSFIKADLYDPISTSLPSGSSATIDGVSLSNGDQVLFSNLSSGNNRIYEASGVGSSITWTAVDKFNQSPDPTDGDSVRIKRGDAFQEQIAFFDGSQFLVNDVIRLFDGVSSDFWELGSIKTTNLTDNTTGNVFSVNVTGSENFVISYAVKRGAKKETGQIVITSDGSTANLAVYNTAIDDAGVSFDADVNSGNLRLRYTTTSTGTDATMKYFVQRWSDSAGGPTGIPSYSTGSTTTTAAGNNGEIQFNSGGNLGADSDFVWEPSNNILNLANLEYTALASSAVNDNQSTAADLISYDASTYPFAVVEYSIERDVNYRVGRILITTDGSSVNSHDDFIDIGDTGVTLTTTVESGNVKVQYTSTSTGNSGTFKYSIRRWA